MADYLVEEYLEMLNLYNQYNHNAVEASRAYARRHPNIRHPSSNVILRLVRRFQETGNVKPRRGVGGGRVQMIPDAIRYAIIHHFEDNPGDSTRSAGRYFRVSHTFVDYILRHEAGMYPYHKQSVQELYPGDAIRRLNFCLWVQNQLIQDNQFTRKILFTDESKFDRSGICNIHNDHHWARENPHDIRIVRTQRTFKKNLWCGIINDQLIGPVVLPDVLNGVNYLDFLRNNFVEALEDENLPENYWFMHDGAPAHFAEPVRLYLDQVYRNRWIGRGGTVQWPARSPDLNPLDFYLWGTIKSKMYIGQNMPETLAEMDHRLHIAIMEVVANGMQGVVDNFNKRVNACIEAQGGHFEQFL